MKTNTELILVADNMPTLTRSAQQRKAELLTYAGSVDEIRSEADAEWGNNALHDVTSFLREIEASRVSCKAPFLEIGRAIDGVAGGLSNELEMERQRLSAGLGSWSQRQAEIARIAKQKAWEEEQRIRREAEEQAAIRAMAQENSHPSDPAIAEVEEEVAREALAVAIAEVRQQAVAVPQALPGLSARRDVDFEVTDIQALYDAAPYMVTMVPNRAAIKGALKAMTDNQSLPGIRWWRTVSASVRS